MTGNDSGCVVFDVVSALFEGWQHLKKRKRTLRSMLCNLA